MSEWQKVQPAESHDFTKEPELVGLLVDSQEDVGPNHSMLYTIEKMGGERVAVWGCKILDARLKGLKLGVEVKIVYLGKEVSEKTNRPYHKFDVFMKLPSDELSLGEVEPPDTSSLPGGDLWAGGPTGDDYPDEDEPVEPVRSEAGKKVTRSVGAKAKKRA